MNEVIGKLVPEPILEVSGSEYVHAVLSRKQSSTLVHLINTGGAHFNGKVFTYDEVPPLGPITVSVRMPSRPARVLAQPGGTQLRATYKDGRLTVTVPRLEIHTIIEIVPRGSSPLNTKGKE